MSPLSFAVDTFTASSMGYCLPYGNDGYWLATYLWAERALISLLPDSEASAWMLIAGQPRAGEQVGVHCESGVGPTYLRLLSVPDPAIAANS